MIKLLKRAQPATPPATRGRLYYDSSDPPRPCFIDENGLVWVLSNAGMKDQNVLINGNFDYAQRQAPATLTTYSQTASRVYTADRWCVTNENASTQYRRVDTAGTQQAGLQTRFYGEYSKITALGKITISQPVEAGNCQHLRGRKVRLQAKLKASSAKTLRLALLQLANAGTTDAPLGYSFGAPSGTYISAHGANSVDPTFGVNLSKIAPDTADNAVIANNGLSCAVTTVWQRFGGTFTLPTDFKNLIVVAFTDSQFAIADNFGISEVGLYDGTEIRDWAERPQSQQLANCQRYYAKTFNVDSAPVQNAGAGTGEARWPSPVGASVAFAQALMWLFPVPMRSNSSTITLYNPSAANNAVRNMTLNTDCTGTASSSAIDSKVYIGGTTPASTVAGTNILGVHITVDAEL